MRVSVGLSFSSLTSISGGGRSSFGTFFSCFIRAIAVVIAKLSDVLVGLVDYLHASAGASRRVAVGVPGSDQAPPGGFELCVTGAGVQAQFLVGLLGVHRGSYPCFLIVA